MVLGIYGAGGLGREVLELAKSINDHYKRWSEIVFIADFCTQTIVNSIKVLTFDQIINYEFDELEIVIAVGEPLDRHILRNKVKNSGYKIASLIHPSVMIGTGTILGEGSVICFGCFISCNINIGSNAYIQPLACIGHDSIIGDDSVISSYVCIAGNCKVGEQTYIGMHVPVKEKTIIGSKTIIGMGSVVQRDIPDEVIALGNPARPMKKNETYRVFG